MVGESSIWQWLFMCVVLYSCFFFQNSIFVFGMFECRCHRLFSLSVIPVLASLSRRATHILIIDMTCRSSVGKVQHTKFKNDQQVSL